ncbi:MAG: hypothetical protein ABTQ34_00025 [Bdellovibrionales bacterium]
MSAVIGKIFLVVALATLGATLAACGEADGWRMPHLFRGSDVPEEVLAAPSAVSAPRVAPEHQTWPRLGDVPKRPQGFAPQAQINKIKGKMRQDRAEGEALLRDEAASSDSGGWDSGAIPQE